MAMSESEKFLRFTDEDGDPLYVKSDLIAIFTKSEKATIGSMLDANIRTVKSNERRGIVSQSTGQWAINDSYEEIMAEIDRVSDCE